MPQQLANAIYDVYSATRQHFHSNGLAMMPTAGVFPCPASVVALNGGLDIDAIAVVAGRRGQPPAMPTPIINNSNRVFLGGGRVGEWANIDVAGVQTYYVSVYYLFGILTPEGLTSDFMLGLVPFPGLSLADQLIPAAYFQYNLINGTRTTVLPPTQSFQPLPALISGIANLG